MNFWVPRFYPFNTSGLYCNNIRDPPASEPSRPDKNHRLGSASSQSLLSNVNLDCAVAIQAASANHPPSQPYMATGPNQPPPIKYPVTANNMHQTSSRLLRMTDDGQPFTRVCSMVLPLPPAWPSSCVIVRPSALDAPPPPPFFFFFFP
jgi:hypothetical protein